MKLIRTLVAALEARFASLTLHLGICALVCVPLVSPVANAEDILNFGNNAELARINPTHAEFSSVDAHTLKIDFATDGSYPTIAFPAPAEGWDLSKYAGVQASVTNKSTVPVRLSLRVDGPGDWKLSPWNSSSVRLMPGETKPIKVTFGMDDTKPGYAVDPSHINQILLFAVKPTVATTVFVTGLSGFGTKAEAQAERASALATAEAAKGPANTPVTGPFFDFSSIPQLSALDTKGVEFSSINADTLQIDFGTDGAYPTLTLPAPAHGWNFSKYAGISMDFTNKSAVPIRIAIRIDGEGEWRQSISNGNSVRIAPGETKTLQCYFGMNDNAAGPAVDASRVSRILIFAVKPTAPATVLVSKLTGFGLPGAKDKPVAVEPAAKATAPTAAAISPAPSTPVSTPTPASVPANPPVAGALINFGKPANLAQISSSHAEFTADGAHALKIAFAAESSYPTVTLMAPVGGWNLSKYSGVQAEVVNNGDLPVQLALRVDNTGDWRQSPWNVESIRLQPRETRLLQVNFGKSSSNPGFVLDSAHISQILIFALKPGAPATVVVKNLSGFGVAGQAAPSVPVNAALAQR